MSLPVSRPSHMSAEHSHRRVTATQKPTAQESDDDSDHGHDSKLSLLSSPTLLTWYADEAAMQGQDDDDDDEGSPVRGRTRRVARVSEKQAQLRTSFL